MRLRSGFLLLEVMVTIVIVTAGLLFVMRVYTTTGRSIGRSAEFFNASLALEETLFPCMEKESANDGSVTGEGTMGTFTYSSSVVTTPAAEEGLAEVSARVTMGTAQVAPYAVTTYLAKREGI